MFLNLVDYDKKAYVRTGLFVYRGTAALKKGYGMCYDLAYATSENGQALTDSFGSRGLKTVAVPSKDNSRNFAGVLTQDYSANPDGKARLIELALPGGCAMVALGGLSTVNKTTLMTCGIGPDAGRFTLGGFTGRGSALALQTKTIADKTDLTFASLDGTATEATAGAVTTITKAGIGTACGFGDATVNPKDFKVVIVGGGDDDEVVTPKVVNVLTAPTANTITVSAASGATPFITLYVYKANPTVLAYLLDGDESGLVEFVSPNDGVAAQHQLPTGVTFVCGGYTITTGNSTSALATGKVDGEKKGFAGLGALTTNDFQITLAAGVGLTLAGTALSTVNIDAAGEQITLEWHGNFGTGTTGKWRSLESAGAAEA